MSLFEWIVVVELGLLVLVVGANGNGVEREIRWHARELIEVMKRSKLL